MHISTICTHGHLNSTLGLQMKNVYLLYVSSSRKDLNRTLFYFEKCSLSYYENTKTINILLSIKIGENINIL